MTSAAQSIKSLLARDAQYFGRMLNAHLHLFITLTADTNRGDTVKVVGLLD